MPAGASGSTADTAEAPRRLLSRDVPRLDRGRRRDPAAGPWSCTEPSLSLETAETRIGDRRSRVLR